MSSKALINKANEFKSILQSIVPDGVAEISYIDYLNNRSGNMAHVYVSWEKDDIHRSLGVVIFLESLKNATVQANAHIDFADDLPDTTGMDKVQALRVQMAHTTRYWKNMPILGFDLTNPNIKAKLSQVRDIVNSWTIENLDLQEQGKD